MWREHSSTFQFSVLSSRLFDPLITKFYLSFLTVINTNFQSLKLENFGRVIIITISPSTAFNRRVYEKYGFLVASVETVEVNCIPTYRLKIEKELVKIDSTHHDSDVYRSSLLSKKLFWLGYCGTCFTICKKILILAATINKVITHQKPFHGR